MTSDQLLRESIDMTHIRDDNDRRYFMNKVQQSSDNNDCFIGQSVPIELRSRFHGYSLTEQDPASSGDDSDCCSTLLTFLAVLFTIATLPISIFYCFLVVKEYERAVIFRLGRIVAGGARGPGLIVLIPCIDTYKVIDLRTVSIRIPEQEILSKDSVTVQVDAVVYYRVVNATVAVTNIVDFHWSTERLAATTLRNVLGTKTLCQILSERESISYVMGLSLDEATQPWGVKVERVEMKDVSLPKQMQRAMAAEAEATREAKAKFVAAEGEYKASIALKDAAQVIAQSPQALQLRYLQTLHSISAEKNSTIIFPLPMEMFSGLQRVFDPNAPSISHNV